MSRKAPDFEKKANCQKCNTSFGMFTRQHHCRNCGKSYCEKCSAKQIALPHYGFNDAVRVCEPCYDSVRSAAAAAAARPAPGRSPPPANIPSEPVTTSATSPTPSSSSSSSSSSTDASSPKVRARSDSSDDVTNNQSSNTSAAAAAVAVAPPKKVSKCVCGMPLCICPPDKEEKKAEEKKVEAPKAKAVTAPSKISSASSTAPSSSTSTFGTFGFGQSRSAPSYDLKGDLNEQCRDAIKARDHQGVVTLLGARADARFIDRTGNSLVHLAAMFDQIQTVTLLIKNGANIWDKNPSGETAVDLAPPSLAHKMKELSPPPQ